MIRYRDGRPGEGALLGGLARATFLETFGARYCLPDLEAFLANGSDSAYAAELADPDIEVRLAEAGAIPIGFAKLGRLKLDAPGASSRAAEVRQLYVHRPWHGAGVAADLMAWLFDRARARGADELWLSVFSENDRARRFYARHGFIEVAPYRFMVGTQADVDILCRAPVGG